MKTFIFALAGLLALSSVRAETCYAGVSDECNRRTDNKHLSISGCNALYANYDTHGVVEKELKSYANLHLKRSYEYLLSSSYFNNFRMNRAGFSKLFRKLSDDAWGKTIDLIKQITKRGDQMVFGFTESRHPSKDNTPYTAELRELESLSKALDTQKELAERAFYIHKESTKNSQHWHDPQVSQYLEEEFIEYQADRIRELAGFTNDIKNFVNKRSEQDLSLSLYLFDEYLQKVA